jgi:hypothetical protein
MKFFYFSRLFVAFLCLLVFKVSDGAGYVPMTRGGDAHVMTVALRNGMLGVANPRDVGLILGAEVTTGNNIRFQLDSQKGLLSDHLVTEGHYVNWYAVLPRKIEAIPIRFLLSRYTIVDVADDHKTFDLCQQITSNILNLLLSGRVSFSIGELHPMVSCGLQIVVRMVL